MQEQLTHISSYTSKLLRRKFGRGPQSCQATISRNHLVLYIRGFISPMEEVLLEQGKPVYVDNARSVIIEHILEELKGVVQISLDVEVEESYHDWNFPNNSGMIAFTLQQEVDDTPIETNVDLNALEQEVSRISAQVQKVPDQIKIFPISQTLFLVKRIGILIPIERALITKGYIDELKVTKDELEKSFFHRNDTFDAIFKEIVKDIFIDWNLKQDNSLMGFFLGKK